MSAPLSLVVAANLVASVIERRNTIPILSNVLIDSDGKIIRLTATDLDHEISVAIPCKAPKFSTTVDGHLFQSVVQSLGGGDGLHVGGSGKLIVGTGPTFSLDTLRDVEQFPRVNKDEPTSVFELAAAQLLADIIAVSPAISSEETRYYLMGINMQTRDGKLGFFATDGHRLHRIERDAPKGAEALSQSIVSRKGLKIIRAAIEAIPEEVSVKLSFSRTRARLELGPINITTKLIDGTYPDVRRVISTGGLGTLTVAASEMLACVKAAQLVTTERTKAVKLDFKAGVVSAKSVGGCEMTAEMPGRQDGQLPPEIGFNAAYLATICDRFNGSDMIISFTDSAAPTVVTATDSPLLTVIMPMRLS